MTTPQEPSTADPVTPSATILLRTTFNDWHAINRDDALDYAKWKLRAITMGANDEDRLNMVHTHLKGVSFTLSELQ